MKVNYGLFGQGLGDQRLILQPHYPNLLFRIVSHDRYFKTTTVLHSLYFNMLSRIKRNVFMTLISIFRYKTDVTKFLPIRILIKIDAF